MRTVLTVGHSTHPWPAFLRMLEAHGVKTLVDVRRYPGSRRYPQFNAGTLSSGLETAGIAYLHAIDLGGRRSPAGDARNTGLKHPAFRGYADYMLTPAFVEAARALLATASDRRTAVMCAEANWRQCHRRLLSDYLTANGVTVIHIIDDRRREPHVLLPPAVIGDNTVTYPSTALF